MLFRADEGAPDKLLYFAPFFCLPRAGEFFPYPAHELLLMEQDVAHRNLGQPLQPLVARAEPTAPPGADIGMSVPVSLKE